MFGPSRAVVPVEITAAAAAISHQIADPIPADQYNFELRERNYAIVVSSRYRRPRDNLSRFSRYGTS